MADLLQYGSGGGGGGTSNYNDLSNKPKINNTTLSGNKTSADLHLQPEIPVIDILATKVIETDPIKVQFTAEDDLLINTAENPVIILDATPIDLGVIAMTKSRAYDSDYWLLSQMDGNENVSTGRISDIKAEILIYDPETKIGTYENVTLLKENDIVTTLTSDATDKPLSASMGKSLNDIKQNIQDNSLGTFHKTIVPAINEVNDIAKGAQQAISFYNYKAMVEHFNDAPTGEYNEGQNVMIVTLEVPDLWISAEESTYTPYIYIDDETIMTTLKSVGYIQVGYYKLSQLETGKVDLTNYVTRTDYASTSTAGVIKSQTAVGTTISGVGQLQAQTKTLIEYNDASNSLFVSKGTLENVLDNETVRVDKATSLSNTQKTQAQTNIGITTESFVFTMADNTTITKNIKVSS